MRVRSLLTLPVILLGACAESPSPEVAPERFGVAVRHNIEAQIANPDHGSATLGAAPGNRSALAVQRYQTDRVETPIELYTRGE